MALSFVQDTAPVDLLKMPLEELRQPLRARFDSIEMDDSSSSQMKVFLRVRPFTKHELEKEENQRCFNIEGARTILARAPSESFTYKNSIHGMGKVNHKYTFTGILGPDSRQTDVFNKVVSDPVKEFIDGRNSLVFTYGITSSGKTYTIQGPSNAIGILPRSLDIIFNSIGDRLHKTSGNVMLAPENFADVVKLSGKDYEAICKQKEELFGACSPEDPSSHRVTVSEVESVVSQDSAESVATARLTQILSEANDREKDTNRVPCDLKEDIHFSIWVSYAEIYNEYIYDLLTPLDLSKRPTTTSTLAGLKSKGIRRPALELRTDKRGSIYVRGLRCFPVASADDAYRVLLIGRRNQQMASTRLNLTSSRSHTVFSIYGIRCAGKAQPHYARISTLSFCDLAGSERTFKTQNVGERLREAGNINTSLLTLGRCIHILRNNQENPDRPQLVPYRESKLTRLFQSFFTGKGKLSMLVNISQCASAFDETMHVLKFSALAKQIVVHQDSQPMALVSLGSKATAEDEARRSRFRSLGLRTPKPGKRVSIAWENTPLSCGKTSQLSFTPSTLLFTGGDGTLMEEPLEETLTSMTEETEIEYDTAELLSIIEDLKAQLIQAKQDTSRVEGKVREEVCQEMDALVLRLESQHEEALREQEAFLQEQSDRRIQLYLNSVNTTNKRLRVSPSADFSEDSKQELQGNLMSDNLTLRSKIEELDAELSDLRSQCADQKEALAHVTREKDELTLTVTRLQFKTTIAEREAAQKLARSEVAVRELGEQLEKLMTAPKDSSHISDLDCQLDQSRLKLVPKDATNEQRDPSASKQTATIAPTQGSRKKVFSPLLPKRPSDETSAPLSPPANAPVVKTTVFSPVIGGRVTDSPPSTIRDKHHYEDSCVSFTVPSTPATIVKKDSSSLAKENEKLVSELNRMQSMLNSAITARKLAEDSMYDLRQELGNATSSNVGSFLRHEIEADNEEALEKMRLEVETLTSKLNQKESSIRELEMRCVAKHDAFMNELKMREGLTSHCEQLEAECKRRLQELKEERSRSENFEKANSETEQLRRQCEILSDELREAVTLAELKASECEAVEKKVSETTAKIEHYKMKADDAADSLSRERLQHQLRLDRVIAEVKEEEDVLKTKLKTAEEKMTEITKLKSELENAASDSHNMQMSIKSLKNQVASLELLRVQEKEDWKSHITEIEAELQKWKNQFRLMESSREELQRDLETVRKEAGEMRHRLARVAAQRESLERQVLEHAQREHTQKQTLENSEKRVRSLTLEIANLEALVEKRNNEAVKTNERCDYLEREINSLRTSHINESKENHEPSSRAKRVTESDRERSISRDRRNLSSSESASSGVPFTGRVTRSMRHK